MVVPLRHFRRPNRDLFRVIDWLKCLLSH